MTAIRVNAPARITRTTEGYQYGNLVASGLPRAQSHALLLRARGLSTVDAAAHMGCSVQNVKQSLSTLFFKTGSDSSPALITRAFESGILRLLSLVLAMYISLFAGAVNDDTRRSRRDPPRNASRLARRNSSGRHDLFWDDVNGRFLIIPEGTDAHA